MFIRRAKIRTTELRRRLLLVPPRAQRAQRRQDSASTPCSTSAATSRSSDGTGSVLCARIRELLERQGDHWCRCPVRKRLERDAQRIAAQLLNRAPPAAVERPDLQTVDVSSLELIRPRSVGVHHVGLWAMEQLGLEALLETARLQRHATRAGHGQHHRSRMTMHRARSAPAGAGCASARPSASCWAWTSSG